MNVYVNRPKIKTQKKAKRAKRAKGEKVEEPKYNYYMYVDKSEENDSIDENGVIEI